MTEVMEVTYTPEEQALHRKELVEALRSGKYKQGMERLRTLNDEFCCLGVACDISRLGEWYETSSGWHYHIEGAESMVWYLTNPRAVDYFGFGGENPYVTCKDRQQTLGVLNDRGISFEEIAQLIEDNDWEKTA